MNKLFKSLIVYCCFMCMALSGGLYGQDMIMSESDNEVEEQTKPVFRLGVFAPSLLGEFPLGKNFTLATQVFFNPNISFFNEAGDVALSIVVSPGFEIQPRYYFNQESRRAKGKRTDHFSGGYLGARIGGDITANFFGSPIIGFQRSLGKRGFWNISAGPGFSLDDGEAEFAIVADITIGFILNP